MNHYYRLRSLVTVLGLSLSTGLFVYAQDDAEEEEVFELSPFEVTSEDSEGYQATATLGGTRIRTDLRDLSTPLTAITAEFLKDTGSTSNEDLLVYTTNTEVGGIFGNFGGIGNGQGISDRGTLLRPANNTRVRGLESADNTRNFFLTETWWDSYNIDRVEIQRGPNSILFGVGSPAGIINANTKVASFDGNFGKLENELGENGSARFVADYNAEIIDDLLAVRVVGLYNDQKFEQEPAFREDQRIFLTGSYSPQVLPESWASKLQIRASYESVDIEANNPRITPPEDYITLWWDAGNQEMLDPLLYEVAGFGTPLRPPNDDDRQNPNYRYVTWADAIDSGPLNNGGVGFFYMNGNDDPIFVSRQRPNEAGGLGPDGSTDNSVDIQYGQPLRVAGWNRYTKNVNEMEIKEGVSMANRTFPLAERDYYKDKSLSDPSVFDFYNKLIDGDNKREVHDWESIDVSLSQTLWDNRFGVEFYYYKEDFNEGRKGTAFDRPYVSIDVNKNLYNQIAYYERIPDPNYSYNFTDPDGNVIPEADYYYFEGDETYGAGYYTDGDEGKVALTLNETGAGDGFIDPSTYYMPGFTPTASQPYPNANAGKAYIGGGFASNWFRTFEKENFRGTAFLELRASDIFDEEGWLAQLLGRHIFTGLATREERLQLSTQYYPAASDEAWTLSQYDSSDIPNITLTSWPRRFTPFVYMSDSLQNVSSYSGINLPGMTTHFTPQGSYTADLFVAEWLPSTDPADPSYVDPGAIYLNDWKGSGSIYEQVKPTYVDNGLANTQSDNLNNYLGRTTRTLNVLNADAGDLEQLVYNYDETEAIVDSVGVTWQGYLLNGHIVPTVGWREDKLKTYTAGGEQGEYGIVSRDAGPRDLVLTNTGETTSWGVVAHVPRSWTDNLPLISGLSAYYNYGENNKVEARVNYDGNPLVNPSAESEDYGVVISMLDDKLTMKVGKYETKVKNGNLSYGVNALGNENWRIWQMEAWLMSNAAIGLAGLTGYMDNETSNPMDWNWGYAMVDEGWWWGTLDGAWLDEDGNRDPRLPAYRNHPSTVAQLAAIDSVITGATQDFYDNYDIPINVSAVQSAYQNWKSQNAIDPMSDATYAAAVAFVDAFGGSFPFGGTAGLSSQNDGNINGISPNGTIDNTSSGYEVEINYRPTPNWNIQINASKTDAYREDIGQPMRDFIEDQWARLSGPAGDIRMWYGGDIAMRDVYDNSIMAALAFTEESIGHQAPELRPYSFSLVTNYSFTDGRLDGFNVGGAFRWQDDQILGYGMKDDLSGLDVLKPIYGGAEDHIDFWVGYQTKLTDRVTWRIQLNVRNAFEDDGLVAISANPGGAPAAYRISQGMSWRLTNSISF